MKKLLITLVIAGLSGGLLVQSAMAETDFMTLDQDHDGSLTLQNVQQAYPGVTLEDFNKYDADGNGSISLTEFTGFAGMSTAPLAVDANASTGASVTPVVPDFMILDEDHDGNLTQQNVQQAYPGVTLEDFNKNDSDGNGSISSTEFTGFAGMSTAPLATDAMAPAAMASDAAPDFMKLDEDKDGKLTLQEAQVAYPELTLEQFNKADSDGNGSISSTEFTSLAM